MLFLLLLMFQPFAWGLLDHWLDPLNPTTHPCEQLYPSPMNITTISNHQTSLLLRIPSRIVLFLPLLLTQRNTASFQIVTFSNCSKKIKIISLNQPQKNFHGLPQFHPGHFAVVDLSPRSWAGSRPKPPHHLSPKHCLGGRSDCWDSEAMKQHDQHVFRVCV